MGKRGKIPPRPVTGRAIVESADEFMFREEDGARLVKPYTFNYLVNVKDRWEGMSVAELFEHEFRSRNIEYYRSACRMGRITVCGEIVDPDDKGILRQAMWLTHLVHRHEPAVIEIPKLRILRSSDQLIAVVKPAGLPCHPVGQYRKNTVLGVVHGEFGMHDACAIHRLDRPVSGVLLIARNAEVANFFRMVLQEKTSIRKSYVARVTGSFPPNSCPLHAKGEKNFFSDGEIHPEFFDPPVQDAKDGGEDTTSESTCSCWMYCDDPLEYNVRTGVGSISRGGQLSKECSTRFRLLKALPGGKESLVVCEPLTGRSHQIRLHLQSIGFPISNDPLYGPGITREMALEAALPPLPDYEQRANEPSSSSTAVTGPSELSAEDKDEAFKPPGSGWDESDLRRVKCLHCPNISCPRLGYKVVGNADDLDILFLHSYRYQVDFRGCTDDILGRVTSVLDSPESKMLTISCPVPGEWSDLEYTPYA